MKKPASISPDNFGPGKAALLMAAVLTVLFWRSFIPGYVHFSNDVPLGQQNAAWLSWPQAMTGMWADQSGLGGNAGAFSPGISGLLHLIFSPVVLAKIFPILANFLVGLGAWTFFRALKLSSLAAMLGGLAAMLNSTFFTSACWGVASQEIAVSMDFFALALIVANTPETPALTRWTRLMLAGLCVGVNVIEAADIGALFSLFIAAFVFYKAVAEEDKTVFEKAAAGIVQVGVVAILAGFIAIQTVSSLVGAQIQGIAGAGQDTESKAQRWDWATQWSLPKTETLGLVVPGLFGYRMDTPKDMMPLFQDSFRGGYYWGGVGRDPNLDRYLDQGGDSSTAPQGFMRFIGSGGYCGILVTLVAVWAMAQAFRRQNSPFTGGQKKLIYFWMAVIAVSLPLSWGRFAPFSHSSDSPLFYALLYKLPYFSTIRNPIKFLYFLSWALVILFAYGMHALSRRLDPAAVKPLGFSAQLKTWWARAGQFDRRWTFTCAGIFIASVLGWVAFLMQKPALIRYLQKVGFSEDMAAEVAAFSASQAGWFLLLFAAAIGLLTLANAGCFAGPRAKLGGILLGAFLVFDLGRADLPFVIHWDYQQKYEVGSLNPVVEVLRNHPYEHRVAKLLPPPLSTPNDFQLFDQLYGIEWMQHHFPYYNIQTLDVWQMPREPEDWHAYQAALRIGIKQDASGQWILDQSTFPLLTRKWELTNTRYLLGPVAFLDLFNSQFDPGKHRFRIVQRFDVAPKPGILQPTQLEEFTAYPNENGRYALIEFTGALPRAKLYSNWQVNTNDQTVLKTLADLNFDPARTVLVDTPQKNLAAIATNENSGTVEYQSYAPKRIVLGTKSTTASVLLLNDKYDANWSVTVDGHPAELLRCNFIMRGVYLTPGDHTVAFHFSLPSKPLYITLSAFGVALVLCGILWNVTRRKS